MKYKIISFLLSFTLSAFFSGCKTYRDSTAGHFPVRTKPARGDVFEIDRLKNFHFELGRGSGLYGLNTIVFNGAGEVVLHKLCECSVWHTTTVKLKDGFVEHILEVIRHEKIMNMPEAFHSGTADGTQWVLWISQGSNSKTIYCDNYFPDGIRHLAETIDFCVSASGVNSKPWISLPFSESRLHDKDLWNSIK